MQGNGLLKGTAISLAAVLSVGAGVALSEQSAAFTDYNPPARWDIGWYEWMDTSGNPVDGSKPEHKPTWVQDYPYRALLFGAAPVSSGNQKHDSKVWIVFSKLPEIDLFQFEHRSGTKGSSQYGYIRARYSTDDPLLQLQEVGNPASADVRLASASWPGVSAGSVELQVTNMSFPSLAPAYLDFDFYYQCCGNLKVKGLREIDCPYPYILTCQNQDGSGGGSEMGSSSESSSGGSSGGGSSSGGESSGGSSSGGSSSGGGSGSYPDLEWPDIEWSAPDWEEGSKPWEESGSYPWEDDDRIPDLSVAIPIPPYENHGEDGDGENGDTWELPEWDGSTDLPFTTDDLNIPEHPVPIDDMNPDYPIFTGPDDWQWPPVVLPGDLTGFPSRPGWMS